MPIRATAPSQPRILSLEIDPSSTSATSRGQGPSPPAAARARISLLGPTAPDRHIDAIPVPAGVERKRRWSKNRATAPNRVGSTVRSSRPPVGGELDTATAASTSAAVNAHLRTGTVRLTRAVPSPKSSALPARAAARACRVRSTSPSRANAAKRLLALSCSEAKR